jgi:hypothetical protein
MRNRSDSSRSALSSVTCLIAVVLLSACASKNLKADGQKKQIPLELKAVQVAQPVVLRLNAQPNRVEKVAYFYQADAKAYEDAQLRHEKEESLEFTSQVSTVSVSEPEANGIVQFTQDLSVIKKDGNGDLHDFAMPELGETIRVTMDSFGRIVKSGDYPKNSIFYVPAISLPATPVSVGDTWVMNASWLSLNDMVPYELSMVSILKGFLECGTDTCADIEVSGDVKFQGPLAKEMSFSSVWRGRIYLAMKAGSVAWSRIDTEERLVAEHARRDVQSCFEAMLIEPTNERIPTMDKPTCK